MIEIAPVLFGMAVTLILLAALDTWLYWGEEEDDKTPLEIVQVLIGRVLLRFIAPLVVLLSAFAWAAYRVDILK